jgi:hypothetical protein
MSELSESGRIAVLETKMDFLARQLDAATAKIDTLTATLHQVQGGWKVLAFFASIGGAVMGFVGSWVLKKLGG